MSKIKQLWFHIMPGSNRYKQQLIEHFGDIDTLFFATSETLQKIGCNSKQIQSFFDSKVHMDQVELEYEQIQNEGIGMISIEDESYPAMLREIFDPPMMLFTKGNARLLEQQSIAIVGTRKCSEYGFNVAKQLAFELSERGINIVSGMAKGIDEAGHKGALGVGATVGILGTGVNVCYPKENERLYHSILEKGCIVSEYLPYTKPMKYQFPQRNRIISGLSLGTIIVEAEEKSGSLITAQLALEQGREVFAVPGNIHSALSKGTNKLIQEGAKLISKVEDVLDEIAPQLKIIDNDKIKNNDTTVTIGLDNLQIIVYDCLSWQPIQIEEIGSKINMKIEMIEMLLLQLEIRGLIQRLPGRRYSRVK